MRRSVQVRGSKVKTDRPRLLVGEDLPPVPRQARSIRARQHLKEAGLALFSTKGYERASIEDIAARAGVAVGGFYIHFKSKRQLLLVLMDELLESIAALNLQIRTKGSTESALRNLLSQAFSRDLRFLGAYRAWQEATLSDAELAAMERQIKEWTTARVKAVLASLQGLPGARRNVPIAPLAATIDTMFWALIAEAVHKPDVELSRSIDSAARLIYHAMFHD